MKLRLIDNLIFMIIFGVYAISCSNSGEIPKIDSPSNKPTEDRVVIGDEESPYKGGENLNLNHAVRVESQPRRKISCNLYDVVKPNLSEQIFKIDGKFDEWDSIESEFSPMYLLSLQFRRKTYSCRALLQSSEKLKRLPLN